MFPAALCLLVRRSRYTVCQGVVGLALLLAPATELLAQAPAPPAPAAGTAPAPAPVAARPLFVEWVIVAAMVGLSLFVVCKSSRRN